MKRILLALGLIVSSAGLAAANVDYAQPGNVHIVKQQRGVFNAVRVNKDLPRQVCGGMEPVNVDVFHTVGDGMAAVFTGILYTPAHLRVTCPTPTAMQ